MNRLVPEFNDLRVIISIVTYTLPFQSGCPVARKLAHPFGKEKMAASSRVWQNGLVMRDLIRRTIGIL